VKSTDNREANCVDLPVFIWRWSRRCWRRPGAWQTAARPTTTGLRTSAARRGCRRSSGAVGWRQLAAQGL